MSTLVQSNAEHKRCNRNVDLSPIYPVLSPKIKIAVKEIAMAGTHTTIAAANGGRFDSYLASPESGRGAGVVIVSTISGVDSDMTY
jgi:hypothetical protein